MTLTKEEIEMIEREAKEYSEIFAMHDRESVCAGFMEGAAVYYHIVKAERERAGKLMEALQWLLTVKKYKDENGKNEFYEIERLGAWDNAKTAINEYNNTRS